MTMQEIASKISHKVAQLEKAEGRVVENYDKFNLNNYYATRRSLHDLAVALETMTRQ